MSFSVLMSIYNATQAPELDHSLKSLAAQHLAPNQIVLVRDGPVQPKVEQCIEKYIGTLPFKHLHYSQNRGLGAALRDGLSACENELVARVDCDDRSVPQRFDLQVKYLADNPSISVIGGWMKEYYPQSQVGKPNTAVRKTPIEPTSVTCSARRRNPLNHPTVMFRKAHVLASGSYQPCMLFEDYFLWIRMLVAGYHLANIPHVLVETEVDSNYFTRRGGMAYLKHELDLLGKVRKLGFFSRTDATIFVLSRLPMRLCSPKAREVLYRMLLRGY
jgi:glycosyltransferase involved in cell wall biosynthesis